MSITQYEDKSTLLILFESIRDKILEEDNNGNVITGINEVVIYSNQEANEDIQRPFEYPYVSVQMFIDWDMPEAIGTDTDSNPPINGNMGGRQKKGIANIIIHTMFANREDDTQVFFENEPIRHAVHRAIDLLNVPPYFTRLLKTQDQLPIEINGNQDYQTTYICAVKEGALIPDSSDILPTFGVDGGRGDLDIP